MKLRILLILFILTWQSAAYATNLLEVYEQAQMSDPIFQQAISQRLSIKEGVPISVASLLPNIAGQITPSVTRSGFAGTNISTLAGETLTPRNTTTRGYRMTLSITQSIFDFYKFSAVAGAVATSKGADATLNAALQNLMMRVSTAYFNILKDEDNLIYSESSKRAFGEQLSQTQQQFKVGLKTITDVYTAKAAYDTAVANVIAAETNVVNDRENLRVITGKYYPQLLTLSEDFPLMTPKPTDIEQWVAITQLQNWSIKAAQYNVQAALQNIRGKFAGNLPTINAQASMDRLYADNTNKYNTINDRNGPATQTDRQFALSIDIPIFSGGGVVAQTNQATYDYQTARQGLEQIAREAINKTRQSYLGIILGRSQIEADKQAIKSAMSSLAGMEVSYQVGTETLVNVLNQQEKLYQTQTSYATDRYQFVNNVLALKQAAGSLSFDDLRAINVWLLQRKKTTMKSYALTKQNNLKTKKK